MADASHAPSGKLMTHRVVHKSSTKSLGHRVTDLNNMGRRVGRFEFRIGRYRRIKDGPGLYA